MSLTPEQREALRDLESALDGLNEANLVLTNARLYRKAVDVLAAFPPEEGPWRVGVFYAVPENGPRFGVRHRDSETGWPGGVESWWPTEAAARERADELNKREVG